MGHLAVPGGTQQMSFILEHIHSIHFCTTTKHYLEVEFSVLQPKPILD